MPSLLDALSGESMMQGVNDYLNAPTNAAQIQSAAQLKAAQIQQQMYEQNVKNQTPFMQAGYGATSDLNYLLGNTSGMSNSQLAQDRNATGLQAGYLAQPFNMTAQQLQNLPGYQFQLQQGDLAVQNRNSASGSALSGAAMKDMSQYNQGLASSYYQNYYNMYQQQQQNIYNRYSGLAGLGENAAAQVGNNGAQLGTGTAQAVAAAGASQAGGLIGQQNTYGNLAGTAASLIAAFA